MPKKINNKSRGRIGVGWASALLAGSSLFGSLLGLLKERLIITNFGFSVQTDAYKAAFALPDFLFYMLIASTLSVSFIPIFNQRYHGGNKKSAWEITSSLLNLIGLVSLAVGVFVMIFADPILRFVIAPGLDGDTQFLAVSMMRIFAINPILFGISSILTSVQQAKGQFLFSALAPNIYNVGIIFGTMVLGPRFGIMGVAYGVAIGAIAQLLVVAVGCKKQGIVYTKKIFWKNKGFRQVLKTAPVRSLDQGIDYITNLIELNRASVLAVGSIAYFSAAWQLFRMPVALVGISISTAAFSKMSERLGQGRPDLFRKELQRILKTMLWLAIPATILVFFTRGYMARILAADGQPIIAGVLGILAPLLVFRILYYLLSKAFYAQQDTKTPLYISLVTMVFNVILMFYLSTPDKYGLNGLALAAAITGSLEVVALMTILHRRITGGLFNYQMINSALKMLSIGGATSVVAYTMVNIFPVAASDVGFSPMIPKFLAICSVTGIFYVALSYIAKLEEVAPFLKKVLKVSKRKIMIQ